MNTIGAKHGSGSDTVASIFESPVVVAGNVPVETFVTTAAPPTIVWQLTIARTVETGFAPVVART